MGLPGGAQNRTHALQQKLLDHLVGEGENFVRHVNSERLRCLQVDCHLELGRLHDRQVGGPLALQDSTSVNSDLAVCVGKACSITDQAPSRDELALRVDRGNPMACCQRNELTAPRQENGSVLTRSAARRSPSVAKTASISASLLAFTKLIDCPSVRAASCTSGVSISAFGLSGFTNTVIDLFVGSRCCISSMRLVPSSEVYAQKPVTLLPAG